MSEMQPRVILRMGSHAEKDYVEKTVRFLGGLVLGSNLVEATPGATASLLVSLCGRKNATPYMLDPMTYAFGCYVDPDIETLRADMDWIKSDQTRKGKTVRTFKRSYASLAEAFGGVFSRALSRGSAVVPSDFTQPGVLAATADSVLNYQVSRIASEFSADPEYASFAKDVPSPQFVFAPYFYIEPTNATAWLDVNIRLAEAAAKIRSPVPVHGVICMDEGFLEDREFLDTVSTRLAATGVEGAWLWISKFQEEAATEKKLLGYRRLVETLGDKMSLFSMHGGYLSLALSKYGLSGTSHSVGYGEQKDVVPVIGQSTPTVRYYLRSIRRRLSVAQVERCFDNLGITTPSGFHEQICDCVVCRGIISKGLEKFGSFGDMRLSTPSSKRVSQTPAAAKRCRFHFLLNRIKEVAFVKSATCAELVTDLQASFTRWQIQPTLSGECSHLTRWASVLR